jgi:hypothetical protein
MKAISILDRILLLLTGLLAAYQIIFGVEGSNPMALISGTLAFGVLLVAGLLLIILGFEVLDSPLVVIISTLIPLSLSLGLVSEYYPEWTSFYMAFAIIGFVGVVFSRYLAPGRPAVIVLAFVHGVSGLLIFGLPILLSLRGVAPPGFMLVGVGGALIGVVGLLLSFLKTGRPVISQEAILRMLPALLLLTTGAFVLGFSFV